MERVLLIDDDVELCELLTERLALEGFQVEAAHDGESGVARALDGEHTLLILDVMLPNLNGFDVLRRLREGGEGVSRTPVLMLTARGDEVDRIVGLELGADDYLAKPFNPRELIARIRAVLRRTRPVAPASPNPATPASERLAVGDIEADMAARTVWRQQENVELTSAEFDLLLELLRSAGRVVTREELVRVVLGRKLTALDRSIDVHVSNLRKKLGSHSNGMERIKAVRSIGYVYTNPTEQLVEP